MFDAASHIEVVKKLGVRFYLGMPNKMLQNFIKTISNINLFKYFDSKSAVSEASAKLGI